MPLAELEDAVVVFSRLAAVGGVVAPSRAVEDVLVLVATGVEDQLRLESARVVGAVHLQRGRLPVVEGAGQVDRLGAGRGAVAERDLVAAVVELPGRRARPGSGPGRPRATST